MSEFVDLIIKMRERMYPCVRRDNCSKCPLVDVCAPDAVEKLAKRALRLASEDDYVVQRVLFKEYCDQAKMAADCKDEYNAMWKEDIEEKVMGKYFG